MGKAGQFACNAQARAGTMSYSTAATVGDRWSQFTAWAKEEKGVRKMEQVDRELVESYGRDLADQVGAGDLSPAYAQNLVSAINTVMDLATRGDWHSVSPTQDCGIPERSAVREDAPTGYERDQADEALDALREGGLERQAAVAALAREFGLRSKEASLLNARSALREAQTAGKIHVSAGTKGGRDREISLNPEHERDQLEVLARAAEIQGEDRSLVPGDETWAQWREGGLRDGREALQAHGIQGYHDLRAAYACERYAALTGHQAPVLGGVIADREADRAARLQIAEELGHGRIDVVAEYVGHR
jgi:hypothetical protein